MIVLKFIVFIILCTPVIICSENGESVDQNIENDKLSSTDKSDRVSPVQVIEVVDVGKSGDKPIDDNERDTKVAHTLIIPDNLTFQAQKENGLKAAHKDEDKGEQLSSAKLIPKQISNSDKPVDVNDSDTKVADTVVPDKLTSPVIPKVKITEKGNAQKAEHKDEDKEKQLASEKLTPKQNSNSDIETNIHVAVVYDPLPEYIQKRAKVATDDSNKTITSTDKFVDAVVKNEGSKETETEKQPTKEIPQQPKPTLRAVRRQQRKQSSNNKTNDLNDKENPKNKESPESVTKNYANFTKRTRGRDPVVPIVQSENYVFAHKGDFHYSYESGDGTKASERGHLRNIDENAGEAVVGSFSYIGKDGNDYSLTYTADENGYRPVGAHLPTPPPIPPAIARALAYLATKTTPAPVTEPTK